VSNSMWPTLRGALCRPDWETDLSPQLHARSHAYLQIMWTDNTGYASFLLAPIDRSSGITGGRIRADRPGFCAHNVATTRDSPDEPHRRARHSGAGQDHESEEERQESAKLLAEGNIHRGTTCTVTRATKITSASSHGAWTRRRP
jgi:hypothetical protein